MSFIWLHTYVLLTTTDGIMWISVRQRSWPGEDWLVAGLHMAAVENGSTFVKPGFLKTRNSSDLCLLLILSSGTSLNPFCNNLLEDLQTSCSADRLNIAICDLVDTYEEDEIPPQYQVRHYIPII